MEELDESSNERKRFAKRDAADDNGDVGLHSFPIVGIGGSAGALPALRDFFSAMPSNPGMAFVVVLHLSADHESALAEILQTSTDLKVVPVTKSEKVEINSVYVIPPGKTLRSMDGHIVLADLPTGQRKHVVVDLFFRTLADNHGVNAVAIVISGADGDGSIGIKRIKERGGLTIAQDPNECEHDGMPRSAIATGMVDWVLPIAQIPARVIASRHRLPSLTMSSGGQDKTEAEVPLADDNDDGLKEVLAYLRGRTGRNFSHYKRSTILRRVARRMQVNDVSTLKDYLEVLRTQAGETGALSQDLLISVTNYFRDPECFSALQERIPSLFEGKCASDTVRVWVVACATGEEAYSVAMLLCEHAETLEAPPAIQVFATDLDQDAIRVAREGLYSAAIQADVSDERQKRFFVKEPLGLRVRRDLRETILFAVHDVLKDSPFSRLDLVTCRNLMIYLTRSAQTRLLETFSFALVQEGQLFLGSSETVDERVTEFQVLDKRHCLYSKRLVLRTEARGNGKSVDHVAKRVGTFSSITPVFPGPSFTPTTSKPAAAATKLDGHAASWPEMHLKLIEHLAAPSILIDSSHDLIHLSKSAGRFLQYGGGEPSRDILRTIHPSLRIELRAALFQVAQTNAPVNIEPIPVEINGKPEIVAIRVAPALDLAPGVMVLLIEAQAVDSEAHKELRNEEVTTERVATHLDRELQRLKHHLRDTVEQYEISTEELKSSNEELQAMNEELRSASEELETSREELQSINEELSTVNQELKSKVDQLSSANSDMHNLMDATNIATVFLDRELRITRFTPTAVALFNMIPTDLGRPLSDLRTLIEYPTLDADAERVLSHLVPIEREVGQAGGKWFVVRLSPYRTLEDRIAGVVITFIDNTERRNDQDRLKASEQRFSAIVTEATVGVVQTDLQGNILFVNPCYQKMLGYSRDELVGHALAEYAHPDDRERTATRFAQMVQSGTSLQIEKRALHKNGHELWMFEGANILLGEAERPDSVLLVCNDITARKEAEEAHRASEERLRMVLESAREYAIFSTDLDRRVTSWNPGAERLLGYSEQEILGQISDLIFVSGDRNSGVPQQEAESALKGKCTFEERQQVRRNGEVFWASGSVMAMRDLHGAVVGYVSVLRDQSETRITRQALETSRQELELAFDEKQAALTALKEVDLEKDRFLAVLSHELRNPLASVHSAGERLSKLSMDDPVQQRMVGIIVRQSHSMKILLGDLLDMSQLRVNKLVIHRAPVSVNNIVERAVESVTPFVQALNHRLTVDVASGDALIDADIVRLSQVLSNLLGNAVKYTPGGGRIRLVVRCDADCITFEIYDNGIGMEPHLVESMFEMFRQAAPTGEVTMGMGIGLALCRHIVHLHGGTVRGTSAGLDQGSHFTVSIPLSSEVSLAKFEQPYEPIGKLEGQSRGTHKVLVVDDNVDAAWLTSEMLNDEGFEVKVAHNGAAALAMLPKFLPNTVFLDIGLPDIDGFEVARCIKRESWGAVMKVVAVTGWGQDQDRVNTKLAGFDEHLVKPVSRRDLLAALIQEGGVKAN